ncbi:DNA cytosine methyltransferase [Okibacterium fritillariae]|uniref:DNA cytosine methyltransferase n=1 Tax=Okibacterium fritillariae TaxID=123320 RepID=UPI0040556162
MPEIVNIASARPKVLEFFAGIGLARMGLEKAGFRVAWSNDYEQDKWDLYRNHFKDVDGEEHSFTLGDIGAIEVAQLPRDAKLAWGSSPCTDLSLAGSRGGLRAGESNAFWQYVRLLEELGDDRPEVVVLENVVGLATSHGGDDLAAAVRAFNELGYSVDVLALDARRFIPQSRPRLFLVGALNPPEDTVEPDGELRPDWLQAVYGDPTLRMHRAPLPAPPAPLLAGFGEFVETMPTSDERWWDTVRTEAFASSLSPVQRDRIASMRRTPGVKYRTAYRRTRNGVAVWEVRPDDISGCLRTARGGSSKQAVVKLGNNRLQVRWMTPLEYARLMGADDYNLSGARTNQALFAFGDAVAVPAVSWLAEHYLMPLVRGEFVTRDVDMAQVRRG